ncbi:MAG: hypothetical protein HFACDABA_02459 [Anaerolineales bacterium]|nr:hypothetical protein [Anaerolineales bacterium]
MLKKRFIPGAVMLAVLLFNLIPAASPVQPVSAATYCDWAGFVMDVTVPDGTTLAVNTPFIKTWRLKNIGTCTWTTAYSVYYAAGDMLGAPPSVPMPNDVPPGATVDISVPMVAPGYPAHFRGNWLLKNASGKSFGIGSSASNVFWVDINVSSPMIEIYDYAANICAATWHYNGGPIPCPYKESVAQYGYVKRLENPILENGSPAGAPGLLTVPQQKYNGVIMGVFPVVDIQRGDRFQAILGCEYNAVNCYVTYELDYLTPQLDLVTIWKFREKYDGKFYRADVDLSPIAFKKGIKLVLIVSASGPATGDNALWVAPRLVRPFSPPAPTPTPVGPAPTFTPTLTPSPTPTLPPAAACDKAEFVADVTIPDGTTLAPGQAFTKTWRLKNIGTCTWTPSYSLAFVSGELMGGAASSALTSTVPPGATVDLSAYLTAPSASGAHEGSWMLRNSSGGFFGIGASGTSPFWVRINVSGGSSGYNFASNLCAATWTSGAGVLPCPGADGDSRGFALPLGTVMLENGTTDSRPAFLTSPQAIDYGWIQGAFPPYVVQSGDRFQSTIACQYNAALCDVFYRLDYQVGSGPIQTLWSARERYDGASANVDVSLAALVGQNVKFILTILANGPAASDRAMWIEPRILYSAAPSTPPTTDTPPPAAPPTSTPVPPIVTPAPPTATPDPYAGWTSYSNSAYGFNFKVPPGTASGTPINGLAHFTLPIVPNTLLVEKYLEPKVVEGAGACNSGVNSLASETVTVNGISFFKEIAQEGAAGSLYDWVSYSALAPGSTNCITMMFVLHSHNPGAFTSPPPPFDKNAESAVFDQIMSSFTWSAGFTNFGQSVVNGVNARDYSSVQSLMRDPFVFGFWGSQGSTYPPADAVTQLQVNYIGANTTLIPNPAENLSALLGGSNPYTVMGLDPASSQALFVSGWGAAGRDEAILYFVRLPDASIRWHGVLIAFGGFPGSSTFNPPPASSAFCVDPQATALLSNFETAVETSNGSLLSSLVSPTHGLDIRLWQYGNTINYSASQAASLFTDPAIVDWGAHPGSLNPTIGTFAEKILPTLVDVFGPTREFKCNDSNVLSYTNVWPWPEYNFYQVFRPATPNTFDMNYWLAGMEYISGKPYLVKMIHHIWTP